MLAIYAIYRIYISRNINSLWNFLSDNKEIHFEFI